VGRLDPDGNITSISPPEGGTFLHRRTADDQGAHLGLYDPIDR
jgi:hypothetical protein